MPVQLSLVDPYSADTRGPGSRVSFQFWRQPVYQLDDGTLWHPGTSGNTYLDNDPYSFVNVAGTKTPGLARVRVTKDARIDEKKPVGQDGARFTRYGLNAARVEIDLMIWTPDQCRALADFWTKVFLNPDPLTLAAVNIVSNFGNPVAGVTAAQQLAFAAQHPELSRHGVGSIIFTGGQGIDVDNQGRGSFRISAVEFVRVDKHRNVTQAPVAARGSLLDAGATPTTAGGFALPGSNPSNLRPR